jgi:hypothetical protein
LLIESWVGAVANATVGDSAIVPLAAFVAALFCRKPAAQPGERKELPFRGIGSRAPDPRIDRTSD